LYDGAYKVDLLDALDAFGLRANKRLGQNFLCDKTAADAIVQAAGALEGKHVLEIGPGAGALTGRLCGAAKSVCAIELDKGLYRLLCSRMAYENLELVHADAMKIDFAMLPCTPDCVVANLPYYITTALINRFLQELPKTGSMTLMMQREVAERLSAAPGSKAYGSLSVAVQYQCETEIVLGIPPECFYPSPEVSSSLVRFVRRVYPRQPGDETHMFRLVRKGFAMRRKTLQNNLAAAGYAKAEVADALERLGLDARVRAEALGVGDFVQLSDALQST
jgi:16S rRNA (adenine1518-N6/adenine1519-N6)-dimethyltransferase